MATPKNYVEGLPRVSDVVSSFYKFEGTPEEQFFLNWLKSKEVTREEYMDEACRLGTWVHKKVEYYIKTGKLAKRGREAKLVREAARFIHDFQLTNLQTEVYLKTLWYQGTCDVVATNPKGEIVVADWKTWGAAKWKWGMDYKYRRNQSKVDKVRFQMSLYGYAVKAQRCYGVELRDDGYKAYESVPYDDSFIENLMKAYVIR